MDRKNRIFSWGFGGYGRLGHNEPKDELVPRLIKVFEGINRGAVMIAAGSQFSFAVNQCGKKNNAYIYICTYVYMYVCIYVRMYIIRTFQRIQKYIKSNFIMVFS